MHTVSERYQICCVFFEKVKYLVGLGLPQFGLMIIYSFEEFLVLIFTTFALMLVKVS